MRVILLPFHNADSLHGFGDLLPEALLPVVNKPLVEHLLDLLVRHHIKSATLCLRHLPYETEQYCGDGSRWSLALSYAPLQASDHLVAALSRLGRHSEEPYLCLFYNILADLDLNRFLTAHEKSGADLTVCQCAAETEGLTATDPQAFQNVFARPLLLSPRAVTALLSCHTCHDLADICRVLQHQGLSLQTYQVPSACHYIRTWQDYLEVQLRVLRGEFQTIAIPAKEVSPGLWVGRNCVIDPQAEIQPPTLIGANSVIRGQARIAASVIGEGVIIDQHASVTDSIVMHDTYVGVNLNVHEMVIHRTSMVQIPTGLDLNINDTVILGDLQKQDVSEFLEKCGNIAAGILLGLLSLPILIPLYLYSLLRPDYLVAEERYRPARSGELATSLAPRPFRLYTCRSRFRLLQKLPGLINVIRGELHLVGNSPLSAAEVSRPQADWEKLRWQAPMGLFHIWEAEAVGNPDDQERLVMENYYAMERSPWKDIKIFFKSLFRLPR
ncbi:MAG: sugar transferase [Desulfobacca sp.]|uniref:sugar transferase n=1 Tax=Desulfobacca sp. TaxID=2067990 RepID=UPI00404AB54A